MSSAYRIWRMPLMLGFVSMLGLASALIADGWADVLSWLMLAVPVAVILRCAFVSR
jgi:hypothetical protein